MGSNSLSGLVFIRLSITKFVLKNIFWLSLLLYILLEVILTIGFWALKLLTYFPFIGRLLSGIFKGLRGIFHSGTGDWFVYIALSILLFGIVMLPFVLLYRIANRSFKNVALKILSSKKLQPFDVKKFHGDPAKFFPYKIILQMIAFNKEAREWVNHCFKSKDRYEVVVKFEDPYKFSKDKTKSYSCIECRIVLLKYTYFVTEDGKDDWQYKFDDIEIVDGVVLKASDFVDSDWEGYTVPSESIGDESIEENYRDTLTYTGMDAALDFWRKSMTILSQKESKGRYGMIAYDTDEFRDPIKLDDKSVMYLGLNKGDCFLYIYTGLNCNLFDFHLTKSINENFEVFKNDMMFITSKLQLFESNILTDEINRWKIPRLLSGNY